MAKKQVETITVMMDPVKNPREVAQTNSSLQTVLSKKNRGEIIYHAMPTEETNLFKRRIGCVKIPKSSVDLSNAPDIEDVYETDLPWIGVTTFCNSTRQFRSRNAVAVVVDIVKEYDGYLYLLTVDAAKPSPGMKPALFNTSRFGLTDAYRKLVIERDLSDDVIRKYFDKASSVPKQLIEELRKIGYVFDGVDTFVDPTGSDPKNSKLHCALYGRINDFHIYQGQPHVA